MPPRAVIESEGHPAGPALAWFGGRTSGGCSGDPTERHDGDPRRVANEDQAEGRRRPAAARSRAPRLGGTSHRISMCVVGTPAAAKRRGRWVLVN